MYDNHLVVTSPDKYYGEGIHILLVDWNWDHVDRVLKQIKNFDQTVILYLFGPGETDYEWLMQIHAQCSLIVVNLDTRTLSDPIKGHLIAKPQCFYTGRPDLEKLFSGYTSDALGTILTHISKRRGTT